MFNLSGIVFPDRVLSPDRDPPSCKEIRARIAGLDLQIQLLQQQLQTASPGQKPVLIDMIQDLQSQFPALEKALETCVEIPVRNLTISGIERTQATQFFRSALAPCPDRPGVAGPCPDNAVLLVTGKPTILRVYVDMAEVSGQPSIQNLTGVLETRQESSPSNDIPLTPYNAPIVGRREFDIDRGDADQTLNFRIPASRCRGRLIARVTVFDPMRPGDPGFTSASFNFKLDFVETDRVKIRLVRIRYEDPQGTDDAPAPTIEDFWTTIEFVLKTYPIPAVELIADNEDVYDGNFSSFFPSAGPEAQGTTGTIFQILDRYRAAEGLPSDVVYFALIPGPPANKTGASGWAISQRIISQVTGSIVAQELGHLCLGNPHAPCGVSGPDPNYPTYDGYPSASIGEFGFDFVTSDILDPARTFDFMSYCGPKWVSPYTYERLLRCYRASAAARPGGPFLDETREQVDLRLTVFRDGRVTFHDPILVSEERVVGGEGDRTPYLIELHGDDGVLESRRIFRTDPNSTDDDAYEDFHVSIPSHSEAKRLVVTREHEVLGSHDLAANAPTIELETKTASGIASLEWKASCGDAPIDVLLRFSPDGARSWRLIGRGGAQGRLDVRLADLPGSDAGLFEAVAVSRGRAAKAISEEVSVEVKPKRAFILSPANGAAFGVGSNVYFYGAAQSPEGSTPSLGLQWDSDIDGHLGLGAQLVVHTLSPGRHCLTLKADDGCGSASTASVFVTIEPSIVTRPLRNTDTEFLG